MKAIITVGIPCSGKSTFAKLLVDEGYVEVNRDYLRFNVVCPESNWGNYKFSKANEKKVTELQEQLVSWAAFKGQSVVISDTNLNEAVRKKWVEVLDDLGYDVEIVDFPITLEDAWKRDSLRENGVGHSVIYRKYLQWLDYKGIKRYVPDVSKPEAIIVDIDGTLAQMRERSPYDWGKVKQDSVRGLVSDIVTGLNRQQYTILLVSGRDGSCYDETKEWLDDNSIPYFYLFMREEGDKRKDTVVKEEIFWDLIADNWNVVGVIDDRPSVVRKWYELGISNVMSVGNPWLEF